MLHGIVWMKQDYRDHVLQEHVNVFFVQDARLDILRYPRACIVFEVRSKQVYFGPEKGRLFGGDTGAEIG